MELPRVISYSQTTDFVHASTLGTDSDYTRFGSIGVDFDISLHETIIIKHAFFFGLKMRRDSMTSRIFLMGEIVPANAWSRNIWYIHVFFYLIVVIDWVKYDG